LDGTIENSFYEPCSDIVLCRVAPVPPGRSGRHYYLRLHPTRRRHHEQFGNQFVFGCVAIAAAIVVAGFIKRKK
jgi:hypothetical protein